MTKAKTYQFKDTVSIQKTLKGFSQTSALIYQAARCRIPKNHALNNRPHNRPSHCPLMYNIEYHQNHKQFRTELSFPAEPICSPTHLLDFTLPFTLIFVLNAKKKKKIEKKIDPEGPNLYVKFVITSKFCIAAVSSVRT